LRVMWWGLWLFAGSQSVNSEGESSLQWVEWSEVLSSLHKWMKCFCVVMKSIYYLLYICSSVALSAWLPFHGFNWKHILGTFVRICMENVYWGLSWESVWKTYIGDFRENLYGKRILGTFVRICMENLYWGLSWESVWKTQFR